MVTYISGMYLAQAQPDFRLTENLLEITIMKTTLNDPSQLSQEPQNAISGHLGYQKTQDFQLLEELGEPQPP